MTNRERFMATLNREKIGGQVPHFELVFFLTMEAFGKMHPSHRNYVQWNQMSRIEKKLHINDMAQLYIDTAERFHQSAIFVHPNPDDFDSVQWLLETIREKSGNEYYLTMHGDPTWAIPDGDGMMDFSAQMYDEPELLNEQSQRRTDTALEFAAKLDQHGHLLDGFTLCSDYCFNVNPFFSRDKFEELIMPYLSAVIKGYREMNYYTIKHTDGNIMPIVDLMVDCHPHALHSLDPQGGVSLTQVMRDYGDRVALIGNVNCGLLDTGSDEECRADILRALREGMQNGGGYIFSTSNCVYTGMPLSRYEMMLSLWQEYGSYDKQTLSKER
ncbi:MAG: uroporphyrinogen decarboxylase family protein [Clostridia bacterium]